MPRTPAPAPSPTQAQGARVIKKYPNRRLYDTDSSSYVTLAQVRELVMRHQPFVVRDAKTGEDLTRSILLQIILEAESAGSPMFSEAALANLIRFYGHAMQGFMGSYLERNVQAFMEWHNRLVELGSQAQGLRAGLAHAPWRPFMPATPSAQPQQLMADYLEQTNKAFLHLQEQMQEQMRRQAEQAWDMLGGKR